MCFICFVLHLIFFIKYMYTHIPAIDANFRLKCHVVSNNAHDYSLMLGYEYFIKDALYCKYILNYADQEDISVKFISI